MIFWLAASAASDLARNSRLSTSFFMTAEKYGGKCNLRFDDTNPQKEDEEYVEAIKRDIEWLGFKWDKICWASNYFDQMYEAAEELIKKGRAFIDEQTYEEIKSQRGTLKEPGQNSPYRDRPAEESLRIFHVYYQSALRDLRENDHQCRYTEDRRQGRLSG